MRFRGVYHVEFSVLDYDNSVGLRTAKKLREQHPQWKHHPAKEMMRTLPSKNDFA
jgi:hypothetical protein